VGEDRLEWSDETYELFWIEKGTPVTTAQFMDMVHPDDRDAVRSAWAAALKGKRYDIEHRVVQQGMTRWIRERAEMHCDDTGRVVWADGMAQDVTVGKQAGEALRQREQMYAAVMSQSDNGIVLIDLETLAYVEFNEAACAMLGYTRQEFGRLTVYDDAAAGARRAAGAHCRARHPGQRALRGAPHAQGRG
jgi:PAS domain-containing protein